MRIDHLGIAVQNLDDSIRFYCDTLGLPLKCIEEVESQKIRVAFLPVGESKFELLEPTDPESPIAKFIDKKGAGIQHVALRVENIEAEIERLKTAGVQFIGDKPTIGAGGAKIIFIHPKSTNGVLLELCEKHE
jgi:methylmalonyl-CoA/ethylmalonyl-CoA epimerase